MIQTGYYNAMYFSRKKTCQTKLLIKNGNMMDFCNKNYKICNIYSSRHRGMSLAPFLVLKSKIHEFRRVTADY